MVWAALGKAAMGGLKAGAKKVATNKLLNRKKKRPKKRTSGKEMSGNMMNKDNVEQKKGGALAVQPSAGLVPTAGDLAPVSTSSGESDVIIIKKQLIQVRDILKDTQTAKQAERKNLREARQADKRKKGEDKLEKPKVAGAPKAAKSGIKMPSLGLGIGNFLTALISGLIFNKLKDLMPALKKIMGVLKGVAGFIGGVLEKTLGFVVGFIDLSYAGVEKLEEGIEAIGGKGAKKLFNKFGKLFTQIVNAGMIAALLATRVGLFRPRGPKGPKGPKGKKPKWRKKLAKKFKKSTFGKTLRKQAAKFKKFRRALRPKNLSKFIKSGGVGKALRGGMKNVMNFGKKFKPLKTLQNVTKNIKPGKILQRINPFKGMNLGKQAGNLWKGAKQLGSKALGGLDKFAKNAMANLGTMWKGAKAWGAKAAGKLGNILELVKDPKKLGELMKGKLTKSINEIVKKNKTLKNLLNLAKNPKKIGGAIKGILQGAQKSKGLLNVQKALSRAKAAKVGGVDKIITAIMTLINYTMGGESPINAVVKGVSGMLGYAAGFAIGAPFGGMPGFITGMIGGALGELAGYGLLKGLAHAPGTKKLTEWDDPIMNDGRPVLRDPDGPIDHMVGSSKEEGKKDDPKTTAETPATSPKTEKMSKEFKIGKKTLDLSKPMGGLSQKEYANLDDKHRRILDRRLQAYANQNAKARHAAIKSNQTGSSAEGLDTKPSYGSGGFVTIENTTTYIQPVEV